MPENPLVFKRFVVSQVPGVTLTRHAGQSRDQCHVNRLNPDADTRIAWIATRLDPDIYERGNDAPRHSSPGKSLPWLLSRAWEFVGHSEPDLGYESVADPVAIAGEVVARYHTPEVRTAGDVPDVR
jgi:hypothetical protein